MKLVLNVRLLEIAYQKITPNRGALTEGVNNTTADQISEQFFIDLSNSLREEKLKWRPVRRVYVDKPGKKEKRPLGIPTFENRIVQEAIRIVLNVIYKPEFQELETNYGFRLRRSVEMAMNKIKYENKGMTTAIVRRH